MIATYHALDCSGCCDASHAAQAEVVQPSRPQTFQSIIRTYAHGVGAYQFDTDLTKRQARLTQTLLNLASNAGIATVYYPPTDGTRDEVCRALGDIVWQARPLLDAVSLAVGDDFETSLVRALAILHAA